MVRHRSIYKGLSPLLGSVSSGLPKGKDGRPEIGRSVARAKNPRIGKSKTTGEVGNPSVRGCFHPTPAKGGYSPFFLGQSTILDTVYYKQEI